MAKRLIKIAKELNVGTTTIVDHLASVGFEIENKPTAKVSDEMEVILIKEFQKDIAIKERADQLVIGTRPTTKKAPQPKPEVAEKPAPVAKNTPSPPPPPPVKEIEPIEVIEEIEVPQAVIVPEVVEEKPKVQLTIKGKIDLDAPKSKNQTPEVEVPVPVVDTPKVEIPADTPPVKETVEEKPAESKEPAPVIVPEEEVVEETEVVSEPEQPVEKVEEKEVPVVEKPVEETKKKVVEKKEEPVQKKTEKKKRSGNPKKEPVAKQPTTEDETKKPRTEDEKQPKREELLRAKTPQLKGLKIHGKIDLDKFKAKKKKKKGEPAADASQKTTSSSSGTEDKKKRRRKRKKVSTSNQNQGSNQGQGGGNSGGSDQNRRRQGSPSRVGGGRNARGGRKGRKPEVKEVSQKEIDDKIKATMARLQRGGKTKRSKIRRDSRDVKREKQDNREQEMQTDKLQVTEFISVSELASLLNVSVSQVITICMNLGVIVSINQRLDAEIIELVAGEFGTEVEFINLEEQEEEEEEIVDDPADLEHRPPIVTVMGHVDHGKTSLLDFIRSSKVADAEAGGITQHIGAYEVLVGKEQKSITFLDTPGHEAFTAMRARGAKVTDVAIIIIAADDSIMPQTKEAISHAQAADVPIIFAINKIDKDGADPERIKQQLAEMNLLVEDWGGKYQSQDISAKQGQNIDLLLEKVLLEAEMLELKANPSRAALGTVIEASLDKGRGYVCKMLVQNGSLKIGDPVVAGEHSGKVKAMFNESGKRIKEAGPSAPVLVLGLSGAPQAGEKFKVMETEQEARQIASKRAQINREQTTRASKRISLDEIGRRLALGTFKDLNLIVKGDVDGSIEALSDSLLKLTQETVQVNIIHKAVGQIIESDVLLASASDAIIVGFQVRPSIGARKIAEKEGVQIKLYSVIYEAIEEIKSAIEGMLEPTREEKIVAQVQVREVYKISRIGTVAGCQVQEGKITRNTKVRIIRNGIVVYPTKQGISAELASLKRFKEDVREVKNGLECGITIKNFNDIKVDDVIEGYEIIEIKQKLKE